MFRDIINLALKPFSLAIRPKIGLVLKGSVDEVREAARRANFIRVNGVEIIGLTKPLDSSCAFLAEMETLQFARLFAGPLTDMECLASLKALRCLIIAHTSRKLIPIDLRTFQNLESATIDWFRGAETIFKVTGLKSLNLSYCPMPDSEELAKLLHLERLSLIACELTEISALRHERRLTWLALSKLNRLEDFSGISNHPAIRFLWIEGCSGLRKLDWLAGMQALETLRILDCGEISGVEALRGLPHLRHIHIHGAVRFTARDMSFLRELPNIESVVVKGLPDREAEYWKRRNKRYDLLRSDLVEQLL